MKRPALCIGFPYVLGLTLASVTARQLWLPLLGVLSAAALAIVVWRRELWKYVLLSTLSCLTACCVYWHADAALTQNLTYAGQETVFTGTVTQAVQYPSGWAKYALDGTFDDGDAARVEWFTDDTAYVCGDRLTLTGTPQPLTDSFLYSSAAYAKSQGMVLQFSDDTACVSCQKPVHRSLRMVLRQWRTEMTRRIRSRMGTETGIMLTGMLFGDKAGMPYSERSALSRMGISHVMAVSGLHLDFLAAFAAALLKRLRAGRKLTFAVMSVLCVLFVICAGETVAVTRACIMILIRQLGTATFRRADALNSLSIASLFLAASNSFVIHSAAFWLSVTATFGIAVVAPYMTKHFKRESFWQTLFADAVSCGWCFLAVLPVSVIFFREVSVLSPLSNTFLIPVCMGSMAFGVLALVFGCQGAAAELFLGGADVMNGWILSVSRVVAAPSWTQISTGSAMLLFTLFAGIALTAALHFLMKNRRVTAIAAAGALAATALAVRTEHLLLQPDLRIAMLGEGGTGIVILTDGESAVFLDLTGRKNLPAYAQAYLAQEGIDRVEELVLCKPSAKSIRQYEGYLVWHPPGSVRAVQAKENLPSLLGTQITASADTELLFRGAKVTADAHGVRLEYAGNVCVFTNAADLVDEAPEVLCLYGKSPEFCPDCGILIVPEGAEVLPDPHTYIGEEALELTVANNGTCRIRRLYGEN